MQKEIISDIKAIKKILAHLIGSNNLSETDQFSPEALDKAATEYRKLSVSRGDWVNGNELYKYFKGAHWDAGRFLRESLGFSNFFKQGKTYYYNKEGIKQLASELKSRNVNLARYIEYKNSQIAFKKKVAEAALNKKASGHRKDYLLPKDVQDIQTSSTPKPPVAMIREDLKMLKEEFFEYNLDQYIDIYHNNYAMVKFDYQFNKYRPAELKQRCKKWCESFNYANHALEEITRKRDDFIPVKDDDMIQL